jgi:short-subunit dehydrogenase
MTLQGRVAAITGASAGIGLACAKHLAREGVAVVLGARRVSLLEATAKTIESAGGRAAIVQMDVTREDDVQALVAAAVREFGRLDVMICNAGFGIAGAIDEISAAQMRELVDINYMGTFHAARAALTVFRRQRAGHIVVISSIVGKRGVPYMGAYAATKFAQVGLAECLRAELAGSPIRVSVVYPVSTDTDFFDVMTRETGAEVSRAFGPRQSVGTVADVIARAIEHPTPEVYPHFTSRFLVVANAIAPGFTDRIVQRFGRKPVK